MSGLHRGRLGPKEGLPGKDGAHAPPESRRRRQDMGHAMLDDLLRSGRPSSAAAHSALLTALESAAGAVARLDQALDNNPLLPAFLFRARLEAVRRQAAVDGRGIDPWHLAAVLEGLRLRMPDYPHRIIDRSEIFGAARAALALHQWIVEPDFDQVGEIQAAEQHLSGAVGLAGVGDACWSWLDGGGGRAPLRGALVRLWTCRRLLRVPVPLTGPRSLSAEAPRGSPDWTVAFLHALAGEATDYLELLRGLEHSWSAARARAPVRRGTSRAPLAIDVLAATPLISATTLARAVGMSIKCAGELLERFVEAEIAVEVTHRSARRLFGLAGMAPMREVAAPPRRPVPGRGRGRPRLEPDEVLDESVAPAPLPPISRFERPPIDYGALEEAMAHCDAVIRTTRSRLQLTGANGPA